MGSEATNQSPVDPFDIGQITERLPAWEVWEDGIEPAEDTPVTNEREKAA